MKRNLFIIVIILTIILASLITYWYNTKDKDLVVDNTVKEETTVQTDFKLESTYQGDYSWEYRVTGSLPNICYKVDTQVAIMESYPEQVIVQLKVTPPQDGEVCTQVIYEYEYEGIFSASKEAEISLEAK